MREQLYLRIALAAAAVTCALSFIARREHVDLVAALLFVLVTHSTGRRRSGAFLGAIGASAAVLVIRVHQYLVGTAGIPVLWILNVVLPVIIVVMAVMARKRLGETGNGK
ncbi:MAG: hypothetical protein KAW17_04595 [Candidatus Eisenbacteria sp.]|nr:hypothetical protein [Candidatus Eisenbacteria bacterium]